MQGLDLVVVIGGAILVGGLVARRLRVPPSLVLLVLGSALGFIPGLGGVELPSDLVLLLFLPVLLYWESLITSLREIRRNLRRGHPQSAATPFRQRVPGAWAGFRGAVSLALALGLPAETAAGDPLPARDLIVTATFVVILFTLLVQGLTMPAVVRWARLPADPTELDEELLAEQATVQAVPDELPAAARRIDSDPDTVARVEREYRARLERIHRSEDDPAEARREEGELDRGIALRRELLPVGRDALVRLRDEGRIDDVVLRRVQRRLDLQELRLDEE